MEELEKRAADYAAVIADEFTTVKFTQDLKTEIMKQLSDNPDIHTVNITWELSLCKHDLDTAVIYKQLKSEKV